MEIKKISIPVNFDLSFLKIRWSDHVLIQEENRVVGEGVVYGGNWEKAEKLAKQMAEMGFRNELAGLKVCEQIFVSRRKEEGRRKKEIQRIINRGSNLKVKVGRNVFEDIKRLEYIKNILKFPNKIRIDANQGYSLKQLQYIIPTLKELGIEYVEEPVKIRDLKKAVDLLHRHGLKIILDESLNDINFIKIIKFIDAINIKLSRIGDINEAVQLIKLCRKHGKKAVIGCSEELERGMKAIYALGQIAKKEGMLLEIEGFGPLRLKNKALAMPRWLNRIENLWIILFHKLRQLKLDYV